MKQDTSRVLILTKEGGHRESIRKSLMVHRFQADFCNSSLTAYQLLASSTSGIFLHDWDAIERSQAIDLQRRINRMEGFAQLLRVVYAPEISPSLLAIATDTNIRRVMSYATANLSLAAELQMLVSGEKTSSDLQRKVRLLSQGAVGYHQEMLDKLIDNAYQQHAHDPLVKMEYAGLCFRRDNLTNANAIIEEILAADPNNVRAMSLRSRILMRQGAFNDAAKMLEYADVLSPRNPDRLCQLGETFYAMGKTEKAKTYFQNSLELDPENKQAQKGLGVTLLDEGDANAALKLFKQSLSEEEAAGFFNNAAVQAVRRGETEKSLRLYETAMAALRSDKLKPLVHFNIGLAHRRLGHIDEALREFHAALKFDPGYQKAQQQIEEIDRQRLKRANQ